MEVLGERIAELSAHLQAADYRLLCMMREFDEGAGWVDQGARSCAHWLSWRIGLDPGAAREKLRVAHALAKLPRVSASMSSGKLSYSKVRALTRVATPENEEKLLHIARGTTASQLERVVRAWRRIDQAEETDRANLQQQNRALHVHTDEDGMVVIRGRLPSEAGAVLVKALEAASDALYRENEDFSETPAAQRRADALRLVAESALENELDPGTGADRYQVVVHVDENVLEDPAADGQSVLDGGNGVSAETSRRIACDASVVAMKQDEKGNPLDVGRKRRTIPPAIRRALDARDPTCRYPGCDVPFTQGHHVRHWANGGATKLSNLINLCHFHHHLVHDGGYSVELDPDGTARFFAPNGWLIREHPELPQSPPLPIEALKEGNLDEGVAITGEEGRPEWGYAPMDLELLLWRPKTPSERPPLPPT